jgi:hypothetical protein
MFQTHKSFFEADGVLYQVLKAIKEHHKPIIDVWKEYLSADRCFRQGDTLFFVREVPEAEIVVEEIEENKNIQAERITDESLNNTNNTNEN